MNRMELLNRLRSNDSQVRHDAAAAFISQEVQHIAPEIVTAVFAAPEWSLHLPLEPGLNEANMIVGFDVMAPSGRAEAFTGSGSDLPMVGAVVERITRTVYDHGIKRELSDTDLMASALAAASRQAMFGQTDMAALDRELEKAAIQAVAEYHETMALVGRSAAGLLGVTNQVGLPEYTVPLGGAGSALWANKTGEEIVSDLTGLLNTQIASAKRREYWPNHMAISLNEYLTANDPSKKLETTNETPLSFFRRNNLMGTDLKVEPWTRLNGMGSGSTGFALCYKMESGVISYAAPVVHKMNVPPKREVAGWQWAHTGRSAGVLVRRPFAVAFMQSF